MRKKDYDAQHTKKHIHAKRRGGGFFAPHPICFAGINCWVCDPRPVVSTAQKRRREDGKKMANRSSLRSFFLLSPACPQCSKKRRGYAITLYSTFAANFNPHLYDPESAAAGNDQGRGFYCPCCSEFTMPFSTFANRGGERISVEIMCLINVSNLSKFNYIQILQYFMAKLFVNPSVLKFHSRSQHVLTCLSYR